MFIYQRIKFPACIPGYIHHIACADPNGHYNRLAVVFVTRKVLHIKIKIKRVVLKIIFLVYPSIQLIKQPRHMRIEQVISRYTPRVRESENIIA